MEVAVVIGFSVAFVSGVAGSSVRHFGVTIERTSLARIGVELMIGFMSAIVFLMVMTRVTLHPVIVAIPAGLLFGYFMSSATVLRNLK